MNRIPLKDIGYTHEVIITLSEQEPVSIPVLADSSIMALVTALRVKFGTNRDDQMPPMLISVRTL
jgi:hypothetical protein